MRGKAARWTAEDVVGGVEVVGESRIIKVGTKSVVSY